VTRGGRQTAPRRLNRRRKNARDDGGAALPGHAAADLVDLAQEKIRVPVASGARAATVARSRRWVDGRGGIIIPTGTRLFRPGTPVGKVTVPTHGGFRLFRGTGKLRKGRCRVFRGQDTWEASTKPLATAPGV